MRKTTYHPYNNIFVKTMSVPHFVEKLIEHLAGELKGKIKSKSYKLATETFIDEVLRPHLPDVMYEVQYDQSIAWMFLLFEHKSNPEHVKIQTGRYIFNGLHQQKLTWKEENSKRKKAGKAVVKNFNYKLILPIIFYHGEQKWTNRPFSELFNLPDDSFNRYLPDFDYVLIDLNDFSDEYIEQIGDSLLAAILLLLKHKGDKTFVKQHAKKIFKFVGENPNTPITKDFLKALMEFIYQTLNLKQAEVKEIAEALPSTTKMNMVNTWDRLIEQGRIEGIQIGEMRGEARGEANGLAKGLMKGKLETEIKKNLDITLSLIKQFPLLTDIQIASILKIKSAYVKEVRVAFSKKSSSSIKKFIRQSFKELLDIDEKKWQELDKWGIDLWKEFKKKDK